MAYKKCLIATTKNLFDIDSVSFFTKDSNGEYKSNKHIHTDDILWIPVDNTKQVTISGYIKCPVGKNYMFRIVYTDGTDLYKDLISTGNYIYQTITSDSLKTVSYIGFIYNSGSGEVYIKDVQIEEGSTATSYVPYGYLPSYKKIIKLNNNPVQLLDKSKYHATTIINGVTFTNNGDGTISVNGTATAQAIYSLPSNTIIKYRRYLVTGCPSGGSTTTYYLRFRGFDPDIGNGRFIRISYDFTNSMEIVVNAGTTVNNLVFTPQLYDFTAMFGDNVLTVSQFRAKYPNDIYDYNPSQYLISYRKNLVTDGSTKNLFDVNNLNVYTSYTLPRETAGVYNGNIIAKSGPTNSTSRTHKTLQELCPNLEVGKTYILSFETTGTNTRKDEIYLGTSSSFWTKGTSRTITANDLNSSVYFYANYPDLTVATISHFQIEEGTVATSYVPYQYL